MRIIASTNLRLALIGLPLFIVLGANDQGSRSIFDGTSGKGSSTANATGTTSRAPAAWLSASVLG